MMKLSDYVIDFIAKQGVSHIFEFVGGAITHLLDSTYDRKDIDCVSVHHEQVGAFAAEAYARVNGNLGVAMATSGPGALNMVTGVGSCYFDSVPCLFITGQVNTYEYKFDRPIRQIGFQETDIVSVVKGLTKYAEMVVEPETIRYHLEKAVYLAKSGRPGPVLLDIPMNIQRAQIDPDTLDSFFESDCYGNLKLESRPSDMDIDEVLRLLGSARRPLILAGGGVRTSGASKELCSLVERSRLPIVTSLMGLDCVPHDIGSFYGMIGVYGNRYANLALANSDFLLILGSRLDSRQTGTRSETFARAAKIVHVDIDPLELNSKIKADLTCECDILSFLTSINGRVPSFDFPDISSWTNVLDGYREKFSSGSQEEGSDLIDPNSFMEKLSLRCSDGDIVCLDVGQNQMWAAQSFRLKADQRMLISGGMGAMGFALPAGIGATKADPGVRAIVISGDGGIQINIQDLETIVSHQLPVKIFVLNNGCLGMVRQFQDMYFDGRQQSTVIGYGCPEFSRIADAYSLPSLFVDNKNDVSEAIEKSLAIDGPVLVEVKLEQGSCVNPKLVVNKPIEDMSPHLDKKEMEDLMLIDLAPEKEVPR